jgi:hypothetical protein
MKKMYLTVAIILTLASSMMFSSCIGSFALTNKVLAWNRQVGSKFVNELVFAAFWVLPVYELTAVADVLVINTIEFWSGNNPVTASTKVVDGKDARYLVKCDQSGYTITNLKDKSVVKFAFNAADNSWSLNTKGESYKFMQFVDDSHVKMITPNGDFKTVELNQQGVYAYEQMVKEGCFAMK